MREGESGRERERERARVRDGERKSGCARQSEQEGGQMEGVERARERDREKQREKSIRSNFSRPCLECFGPLPSWERQRGRETASAC